MLAKDAGVFITQDGTILRGMEKKCGECPHICFENYFPNGAIKPTDGFCGIAGQIESQFTRYERLGVNVELIPGMLCPKIMRQNFIDTITFVPGVIYVKVLCKCCKQEILKSFNAVKITSTNGIVIVMGVYKEDGE